MLERAPSLALFALVSACAQDPVPPGPVLSAKQAEQRILAALPTGWNSVARVPDAVPYGHDGSDREGVLLVLRGPAPILLRGYYCAGGGFCPSPLRAHEALEVWIMPSDYADGGIGLAPAQGRVAERLLADRPVYALVSRHAGPGLDFDGGFTGASSETSALPADPHGDLPLSWTTWRRDITAKLEGGRR